MILLWNSATMIVEMTIIDDNGVCVDYTWPAGRELARDMLAYLRDRLEQEHDATFADITGIGVYRGPGSFTGLRIGVAVLNTFARELQIPIVGATGDNWRDLCLGRLKRGDDDQIILPEYGSDPHITKPRR